jgi:hypothetical protein
MPLYDTKGYVLKPTLPSGHSYAAYRTAVDIPPVYRSWMAILEAVRSFEYFIKVSNNEAAERWINEAIGRSYNEIITNACNAVLMGFQVAEMVYLDGEDGLKWPLFVWPYPDYVRVKIENGEYKGFYQDNRNINRWAGTSGEEVEVSAEQSILWSYGPAIHGNPYGRGLMQSVYDYATDFKTVLDSAKTSTDRQNYPLIIMGMAQGMFGKDDIDDYCASFAKNIKTYGVAAFSKPNSEKMVELETIQPVQSAVPDAVKLANDYVRYVAMGMLASLKTFFNAADDAGSYALSQVQLASFDRIITGIYETLKPGLETIIRRLLRANFGDVEFELDVERVDELSLQAAAKTFDELVNRGNEQALELLDIKRLADKANKPIRGETLYDSTTKERLAKLPEDELDRLRAEQKREFRDWYDDNLDALAVEIYRADETRARSIAKKWTQLGAQKAKAFYVETYGENPPPLPEQLDDLWETKPATLARQYRNTVDSIRLNEQEKTARGVEPSEQPLKNAAQKLADRLLKTANLYYADLNRQRGDNA